MVKRPREHQYEDMSINAFREAIPKEWVYRPYTSDYGIDGEVEIFDDNDESTGRKFLVQIKSTAQESIKKALAVRLPIEKYDYYHSFEIPVLIVRYCVSHSRLFVKWFHKYDRYYGRKDARTFTFRLDENDEWDKQTSQEIVSELDAIALFKSQHIPLPIVFKVIINGETIHGVAKGRILSVIKNAFCSFPAYLKLVSKYTEDVPCAIEIFTDKITVNIAGFKSYTLHHSDYDPKDIATSYISDLMLTLSVALSLIGQYNIASKIIANHCINSSIALNPAMAMSIADIMALSMNIRDALELSELLYNKGYHLPALMIMSRILMDDDSYTAKDKEYIKNYLLGRIKYAEENNNNSMLATYHYNYGNFIRMSSLSEGLHHYRRASYYDETYKDRSYYNKELGGLLFEARRYKCSSYFYKTAIEQDGENICAALYADSLIYSGEYRKGIDELRKFIEADTNHDFEWHLKCSLLENMCAHFKIETQYRMTRNAMECAVIEEGDSLDHNIEKVTEAIKHDMLCTDAWFYLGNLEAEKELYEDAFSSYLVSAVFDRNNISAWCNAINLGLILKIDMDYLLSIISVAYNANGQVIFEVMSDVIEKEVDGPASKAMINLLNEISTQLTTTRRPFELRFLHGDKYTTAILVKER